MTPEERVRTFRDLVIRLSSEYGVEKAALEGFDEAVKDGADPQHAAWAILYDLDLISASVLLGYEGLLKLGGEDGEPT